MSLQSVETFKRFDASLVQRTVSIDSFALAESLLVAGNLPAARRIAERLEDRAPNDPRVLTLLGRIHLEWPVIGRFAAESLFARAGRIAPDDPAPYYWMGHTGLKLGGDDGEMIARRGLLRVLAINPAYRDVWSLWTRLYAGRGDRLAALRALAPHAGTDPADHYRARLLLDLHEYDSAAALLAALAARHPGDAGPRALLARALFEQGDDAAGWAMYERALAVAHLDTAGILWRQVRSVATPTESELWRRTLPEQRAAFFRVFWTRREPNLFTAGNERVGEHFRRMVDAQRDFRVLHPNSRYHRSKLFRSLVGIMNGSNQPEVAALVQRAQQERCSAGLPDSIVRLQYEQGLTRRLDTADTDATPNLEDGLDDRGRVWMRHGRPDVRFTYGLNGETWCYERPGGVLRVTFVRRTGYGGASGDLVFTPTVPGEIESAELLMATDRPGTEYRLDFVFWHAAFRSADDARTDLLLFPDSALAAGALMDDTGYEVARDTASGHYLEIRALPGRYLLMLDARRGDRLGSYRGPMPLPDFTTGELAVSSLLVASGDVAANRDSMAAAAPFGLRLPAGEPMRLYAELYGLGRVDGGSRYEARYRFTRLDGERQVRGRETIVSFQREARFAPRVIESLVVDPGRLAPGRYRVRLEIVDQIRSAMVAGASMEFQLR